MILLTGGSGYLGREMLGRLLVRRPPERIALLLRASRRERPEERLRGLLTEIFGGDGERFLSCIEIIEGDVAEPRFGMGDSDFCALAARTRAVFHCAATTGLNGRLDEARRINVGGTEHVLHFSEEAVKNYGPGFRLFHISTAYVAGNRVGIFHADDLSLDGPFKNPYEQTKAEAEALVRDAKHRIPVCIFRPSIIVGDSVTGQTSAFNVIYIPAKLLVKGLFSLFPGAPQTPFDLIPVDYAADAIVRLSSIMPASGSCYHISAGLGREPTLWEIVETLVTTFNNFRREKSRLHVPQWLPPELVALAQSSLTHTLKTLERVVSDRINVFRQTLPFVPYMLTNPQFDDSETRRDLGALGGGLAMAEAPLFRTYAERLFQYCFETNWGEIPWTNPRNFLLWHQRHALLAANTAAFAGVGS